MCISSTRGQLQEWKRIQMNELPEIVSAVTEAYSLDQATRMRDILVDFFWAAKSKGCLGEDAALRLADDVPMFAKDLLKAFVLKQPLAQVDSPRASDEDTSN